MHPAWGILSSKHPRDQTLSESWEASAGSPSEFHLRGTSAMSTSWFSSTRSPVYPGDTWLPPDQFQGLLHRERKPSHVPNRDRRVPRPILRPAGGLLLGIGESFGSLGITPNTRVKLLLGEAVRYSGRYSTCPPCERTPSVRPLRGLGLVIGATCTIFRLEYRRTWVFRFFRKL